MHYSRVKRHGDPNAVHRLPKIYADTCLVCDSPEYRRGYCQKHYSRWKKYKDPHFQKINSPGVGSVNKDGYKRITINNVRYLEHRYIMEQHLGRPLKPTEHIHHKNGNKLDNRKSNLEVTTNSRHILEHHRSKYFIGTEERECAICGKILPYSEFALSKKGAYGRKGYCKKCHIQHYFFHISKEAIRRQQ